MNEELDQIEKNNTWDLFSIPNNKNAIGTKWIYRNKLNKDGHIVKNKARMVCKGYDQVEGMEFEEIFAPVSWIEAVNIFLSFSCYRKFKVYYMDINSSFLNGDLEEEVYVAQPEVF